MLHEEELSANKVKCLIESVSLNPTHAAHVGSIEVNYPESRDVRDRLLRDLKREHRHGLNDLVIVGRVMRDVVNQPGDLQTLVEQSLTHHEATDEGEVQECDPGKVFGEILDQSIREYIIPDAHEGEVEPMQKVADDVEDEKEARKRVSVALQ